MVSGGRRFEVQWTKVFGIFLVAVAVRLALDPQYPLSRERIRELERRAAEEFPMSRPSLRSPEPLAPRGETAVSDLRFRWQWSGPEVEWTVVVFDDNLEKIVERFVGPTCEASLDEQSVKNLRPGAALHWQVEGLWKGHLIRSMPWPFELVPARR